MTLAALLDGPSDDGAVVCGDRRTTRGSLSATADTLASALLRAGLARRVVGVMFPNDERAVAAWFGVWRAGAAFVALNPRVPDEELGRLVARVGASAVLTTPELALRVVRVRDIDTAVGTFVLGDCAPGAEAGSRDAIVQLTSGTTGPPKAVVLRHGTVSHLLDSVITSLRGDRPLSRARMPNIVPMSLSLWAGIYQVLFAFRLGVPVVLMERFDPSSFARLVREHGIRSSVLPPAALVMLLAEPRIETLEPLRYVRCVSAPLSPAHARKFHERFGIAVLNGYGQTELGGEAIGWSADDWRRNGLGKLGSVGRPHDAFEVRVRADDGALADPGAIGELEIRSSAALAAGEERITDDGWLRTGDLARVDADGFVWIEGRVSAMINRGGLKVFPDEVEEVLRGHPDVHDAAVAGVPDDRLGEVPWAYVVPAAGTRVTGDDLRAWCRERLAPYKVPAGFTERTELPRNEAGKVVRAEL